jgi:tripartite-type tricarboxylate transporter receptor subunit TctC
MKDISERMRKILGLFLALAVILLLMVDGSTASSKYPSSPIEVVVTWPAGGGTDIAARNIIQYVEKDLGQRMNVLNIPGGGGAIGYVQGAKKKPDGYHLTILQFDILSVQAQGMAPISYKEFDTIAMFADQPVCLMVRGDSPFKTLNDFIKATKERQVKMGGTNVGGLASSIHSLDQGSGVNYTYIPFSGIVEGTTSGSRKTC